MLPLEKKCLEQRILKEARLLLEVADQSYLQALPSRSAFIEALENELRFIGLYEHGDEETAQVIHAILEEQFDELAPYRYPYP